MPCAHESLSKHAFFLRKQNVPSPAKKSSKASFRRLKAPKQKKQRRAGRASGCCRCTSRPRPRPRRASWRAGKQRALAPSSLGGSTSWMLQGNPVDPPGWLRGIPCTSKLWVSKGNPKESPPSGVYTKTQMEAAQSEGTLLVASPASQPPRSGCKFWQIHSNLHP